MPEIGGRDAILINPEKPEEITAMMLKLERDDAFYEQQEKYGAERAQLFSWRKTAEQLQLLYKTVYKETVENKGK